MHTNAKLSVWEKDQPAKTLSPLKVHFSDRLSHGNHCVPWPIAAGKVCVSLSYFLLFSHIFQTTLSKMVAAFLVKYIKKSRTPAEGFVQISMTPMICCPICFSFEVCTFFDCLNFTNTIK